MVNAGFFETDITPDHSVRMQGHASRTGNSTGIADSLKLSAGLFYFDGCSVGLVCMDIFSVDNAFYRLTARRAAHLVDHLFLCCSHTHTGPVTMSLGSVHSDADYLLFLQDQIIAALESARKNAAPVSLSVAETEIAGLGVNRRQQTPNGIIMAPNKTGPIDTTLSCIKIMSQQNEPRALIINHGLHPTTLAHDFLQLSSDFPGRMRRKLQEHFHYSIPVLFLQGACGDVRPNITDEGGHFQGGREADIEEIGTRLAEAVLTSFKHPEPCGSGDCEVRYTDVDLPLKKLHSNTFTAKKANNIDTDILTREIQYWEELMADLFLPDSIPANIGLLKTGTLQILFFPLEIFSSTALKIRSMVSDTHSLLSCYSNGNLGYLPSAKAQSEGGYEVETAYKFYQLPGVFDSEEILLEAVHSLINSG